MLKVFQIEAPLSGPSVARLIDYLFRMLKVLQVEAPLFWFLSLFTSSNQVCKYAWLIACLSNIMSR